MAEPTGPVIKNHAAFIWSVADLLRGDYKQSEYQRVILPLTVLRRLDCVLEPTKDAVLVRHDQLSSKAANLDPILFKESGTTFYNLSRHTLTTMLGAPDDLADNLRHYVASFSEAARDVLDKFGFDVQIERLRKANLLYKVVSKFAEVDLHPDVVSNLEMGYLYEELIRRFSELSNETAGEHFTPREVIRLMVNLLFIEDEDALRKPGTSRTILDPACGTGGMLSVAEDWLRDLNPDARLHVYGQELNAETYAVCRSDMMLKGQDAQNIVYGNSFSEDGHSDLKVDYAIANPPFGVEWKKVADEVRGEAEKGFGGRFGAGLPRINDGSFLFLQHMISKMKRPEHGGSRVAIVFNGSPLFTGAAGSGESEIRRWIIENDWLEAVVALPDQLFYNTGISTYFWIVTNRKAPERKGKVQLVDARSFWTKMRKSLGEKRKQIADDQIDDIVRLYDDFAAADAGTGSEYVKVFPNEAFGFMRITVERPLRVVRQVTAEGIEQIKQLKALDDLQPGLAAWIAEYARQWLDMSFDLNDDAPGGKLIATAAELGVDALEAPELRRTLDGLSTAQRRKLTKQINDALLVRDPDAPVITDKKGNPEPDPDLRDNENVPLPAIPAAYEDDVTARLQTIEYRSAVDDHIETEVAPYVSDAWVDHDKTKIGYEIPLTRHFYRYVPPRPLDEIDAEIRQLEGEIQDLLAEVTE